MTPTEALFWANLAIVAATYAGLPLVLAARGLLRRRPVRVDPSHLPTISVVIAARNERAVIEEKVESIAGADYPHDRLEIIVASDGSDDGTPEAVQALADTDSRIKLLRLLRRGKASALNAAVARAGGDVVVFTDANSRLDGGALRALVAPMVDPSVGGVAGDQCYVRTGTEDAVASGEERYWSIDRLLKLLQSRSGNVISATGALYAIRRELVQAVPAGVTDDFFLSTGVIAAGQRLVFASDAVAHEPLAATARREYGRKVRVMTRGLRSVAARRELLDPTRHGFYAVQLFAHKVLRRAMAGPLLALFVASLTAASGGGVYRVAAIGQVGFYTAAVLGLVGRRFGFAQSGVAALPAYFCMVNAAAVVAWWNVLTGRRIDRWEPDRAPAVQEP